MEMDEVQHELLKQKEFVVVEQSRMQIHELFAQMDIILIHPKLTEELFEVMDSEQVLNSEMMAVIFLAMVVITIEWQSITIFELEEAQLRKIHALSDLKTLPLIIQD